jgi:hypothetical protein
MDPFAKADAYQRDALDFMLHELDLDHPDDERQHAVRMHVLGPGAHELIRSYQRLLRRVAELERAVAPDEEEMKALAHAAEKREAIVERGLEDT